MPGFVWIVSVTYLLLVCTSLVIEDLRVAFIPATIAVLGFLFAGFAVFRKLVGAFSIPWPTSRSGEAELGIIIQETPLPFRGYEQELIIKFRVRRLLELGAIAAVAAATLLAIALGTVSAEPLIHGFSLLALESVCIAGWTFLILSARWLLERRFLPESHVTVGEIFRRDPGFLKAGITYQFFDDNRERRGGRGPLGSETDSAVLIFYDPKNPDKNFCQAALRFHKLELELIPRQGTSGVTRSE